ncbi:MAG: hypothetical protein LW817_03100 [Candidatus Caenarcaniphilales bacterium]|nr:hypothetical protein [Candidatus Caenarcaniphilales bacterium]
MDQAISFSPDQLSALSKQIKGFGGIQAVMDLKNAKMRHELVASAKAMNLKATRKILEALHKA